MYQYWLYNSTLNTPENIKNISSTMFKKGEGKVALLTSVLDLDYIHSILNSPLRNGKQSDIPEIVSSHCHSDVNKHFPLPIVLKKVLSKQLAGMPKDVVVADMALNGVPYENAFSLLHYLALNEDGYASLDTKVALWLSINGFNNIAGISRQVEAGFDGEYLCCPHPNDVPPLMDYFSESLTELINEVINNLPQYGSVIRQKLVELGYDSKLSDRALVAIACASETQRIILLIHPWLERVGRTSDECMCYVMQTFGIKPHPMFLPDRKFSFSGLTRSALLNLQALKVLRAVAIDLSVNPEGIESVGDLYRALCAKNQRIKNAVYTSKLKNIKGHNVYPDRDVMDRYYRSLKRVLMNLVSTLVNPDVLFSDPDVISLTKNYAIFYEGNLFYQDNLELSTLY